MLQRQQLDRIHMSSLWCFASCSSKHYKCCCVQQMVLPADHDPFYWMGVPCKSPHNCLQCMWLQHTSAGFKGWNQAVRREYRVSSLPSKCFLKSDRKNRNCKQGLRAVEQQSDYHKLLKFLKLSCKLKSLYYHFSHYHTYQTHDRIAYHQLQVCQLTGLLGKYTHIQVLVWQICYLANTNLHVIHRHNAISYRLATNLYRAYRHW